VSYTRYIVMLSCAFSKYGRHQDSNECLFFLLVNFLYILFSENIRSDIAQVVASYPNRASNCNTFLQ
jgi:hypothetical protein